MTLPTPLEALPNPQRGRDALIRFDYRGAFGGLDVPVTLTLRYIPDREITTQQSITGWLNTLADARWETPEALAETIVKGFYDTLLPGHVDVDLVLSHNDDARQMVFMVMRQPDYGIPPALAGYF